MKLWYSSTSPFVRKVLVTAIEKGLDERIERVAAGPLGPTGAIAADNPVGKVPALVADDGLVLYDSPVICEYLDSLGDGPRLFPAEGAERWLALRRQALGDAAMDAGVLRLMEGRRPAGERSPGWVERQRAAMANALDAMDAEAESLGAAPTIAHVTFCCALGWFDFRFADDDWRAGRPALADWYDDFSGRPSAMATEPFEA